jgi:hypothetical protein
MNWVQTIVNDVNEREPFWGLIIKPNDRCDLPAHLKDKKQVVLQMGAALTRPPRFTILDAALEVVATFSERPHCCLIPWDAIDALITPNTLIIFRPNALVDVSTPKMGPKSEPEKLKPSHLKVVK